MTGDLLTPCCGVPISAYVGGFSEEIEIYCPAGDCSSTWNGEGKKES